MLSNEGRAVSCFSFHLQIKLPLASSSGFYCGCVESFLWLLLVLIYKTHLQMRSFGTIASTFYSPLCFSSSPRPPTHRWDSLSCRASYRPTPTPAFHRTTCSLRTSVPRTTPWWFTCRRISPPVAAVAMAAGEKPSASTSTPSWTSRCSSCTVRCRCAPRGCTTARDYRRYAAGFTLLQLFFSLSPSFYWTSHQLSSLNEHVMWVWCLLKKLLPFGTWLTLSFLIWRPQCLAGKKAEQKKPCKASMSSHIFFSFRYLSRIREKSVKSFCQGYYWYIHRDFETRSFFPSYFPPQCLQPGQPCDSLPFDSFMMMMMDVKTATKPLVVVDGPPSTDHSGQCEDCLPESCFFFLFNVCMLYVRFNM